MESKKWHEKKYYVSVFPHLDWNCDGEGEGATLRRYHRMEFFPRTNSIAMTRSFHNILMFLMAVEWSEIIVKFQFFAVWD